MYNNPYWKLYWAERAARINPKATIDAKEAKNDWSILWITLLYPILKKSKKL